MKLAGFVCMISGLCAAQAPPQPSVTPSYAGSFTAITGQPEPVRAAPYSAEQVVTSVQVLPDGTRIERRSPTETKLYRDGQGRIREERVMGGRLPNGDPRAGAPTISIVTISDPVLEYHYVLETWNKIAHRSKAPVRTGPKPPEGESIGVQIVNGMPSEGLRVVRTIPAGMVGNDRPMETVTEIWTSLELKVPVKQSSRGGGNSDTEMQLINVTRQEPDPELFRVPADYRIVEETGRFSILR